MIKVIVAISGLVLVQPARDSTDQVTIHLVETYDSVAPVAKGHNLTSILLDDHDVQGVYFRRSIPDDLHEEGINNRDALPFTLQLKLPTVAESTLNLKQHSAFPNIRSLLSTNDSMLLSECAYSNAPNALQTTTCQAPSSRRLLRGQINLHGNWTLRAVNRLANEAPGSVAPLEPPHHLRRLAADAAHAIPHSAAAKRFANTFVFEGLVNTWTDLVVFFNGTQLTIPKEDALQTTALCQKYDPAYPECAFVLVENVRDCNDLACPATGGASWEGTDLHFAQLYRLLKAYDKATDSFKDFIFVPDADSPFVADVVHGHGPGGGSSPRCYGGIIPP